MKKDIILAGVGGQGILTIATLIRHARAHNLAQPVDIISLQSETLLNLLTHILRPRLSAEGTDAQSDILLRKPHLLQCLGQVEGIRGRTSNTAYLQVTDESDMLLRVTRRCGYHRSTQILHTIVCTQTTRKQAISVSHREGIIASHPECCERASHHLGPYGKVLTCIPHNRRITRCS